MADETMTTPDNTSAQSGNMVPAAAVILAAERIADQAARDELEAKRRPATEAEIHAAEDAFVRARRSSIRTMLAELSMVGGFVLMLIVLLLTQL